MFFISVVRLISGSVILYSTSYISNEIFFSRFLLILLSFIISIFLLILRPNIICLLLGWDGLGVSSYLLVIYYQSNKSYNAGIITALTNRLGDVGILITIGLILYFGDWTFLILSYGTHIYYGNVIIIIILSACTKRAQIPFSAWLPAAMAAPTPVSALVHSSTLVTAGVYLIIRFNYFLSNSYYAHILIILGIITILIAGIVAILESDIKKVIALSTLSQLGVIIIILGAQLPLLAYFHILCHAYFKAILFICAGIIIHNMKDYQDIRCIGSRIINLPIVFSIINIANLRLCGLPFLRGFYSKDLIIESIIINNFNLILFFLLIFATIFTVIYSCRLSFILGINSIKLESIYIISDLSYWIIFGIIILLPFSIIGGINLINIISSSSIIIYFPFWIKFLVFCLIILRIIIFSIYKNYNLSLKKNYLNKFISLIWFLPMTYRNRTTKIIFYYGLIVKKEAENMWSEHLIFIKIFLRIKKFWVYFDRLVNIFIFNSIFLLLFFFIFLNSI